MTGLLAYENAELDEDVTFSYEAVHSVARGDSNIGMDAGEIIPMNKALEGMMILSVSSPTTCPHRTLKTARPSTSTRQLWIG